MLKTQTKRSWLKKPSTSRESSVRRCRCTNRRVTEDLVITCGCDEYEELGQALGEGKTSNVQLLKRRKTEEVFAAKTFKKYGSAQDRFATNVLAEFYIANGLQHPSIIQTYELRTIDGTLNMVMEYAPQNLFEMAAQGAITTDDAEKYFKQLVAGVAYIHKIGFAHRDIKLENVLISEKGHVKIIDFGTIATGKWMPTADVGSLPYMAPELFTASRYHPQLADAWSIAILYACVILKRFPWPAAEESRPVYRQYVNALSNPSNGSSVSKNVPSQPWPISEFPRHMRIVLGIMLQVDPKQRPMLDGVPRLLREHALGVIEEAAEEMAIG